MIMLKVISMLAAVLLAMSWKSRLLGPSNLFFSWGWEFICLVSRLVTFGVEG